MSYRDFTPAEVCTQFDLTLIENQDLFSATPPLAASDLLHQLLDEHLAIALKTQTKLFHFPPAK